MGFVWSPQHDFKLCLGSAVVLENSGIDLLFVMEKLIDLFMKISSHPLRVKEQMRVFPLSLFYDSIFVSFGRCKYFLFFPN
ncbi:hypothetical protein Scep_027940 [Stephania cephalantha]|uniref:Uncharacterized protein n=1 Tax=Stephania cephalantha TaxID=152367 RepID=A0AAP0HHP0_9MAGN